MRRVLNFLYGLLAGGLVGAGLALLFTPRPGSEVLARLRQWLATGKEIALEGETKIDWLEEEAAPYETYRSADASLPGDPTGGDDPISV